VTGRLHTRNIYLIVQLSSTCTSIVTDGGSSGGEELRTLIIIFLVHKALQMHMQAKKKE
jgi:hypothetical protein